MSMCIVKTARLLGALLISTLPGFPQTPTGMIVGEVADSSGRAIAQVAVVATRADSGVETRTTTGQEGTYQFPALPIGRYSLQFLHAAFEPARIDRVEVHVGQQIRAAVSLTVAGRAERIVVSSGAGLLDMQSSPASRGVLGDEVQNLPLNGRQLQNLVLLAPGVAAGWNWSTAANRYGKARENLEGAFNASGARGRSNNFSLDGVTLNLRQYGVINFEPSVEAVEEFRFVSGTPPPEYGSTMGSAVTIVTRSGGQHYHGSLYEFFRNDKLDANNPFNNAAGLPRGKLRQNQFGGSVGGPIAGRAHFFFVNAEFLRIVEGIETRLVSVPTADEARGLLQFRDAAGSARSIDLSSRINPLSRNLISLFPAPNSLGPQDLNYSSALLIRLNDYQTHTRTDHYLSPKNLLTVRSSWNLNDQEYLINRFGGPFIPGFSLPNPEKTWNAGLGHIRTLGAAVVNELRLGVNRYRNPLANGDTRSAAEIGLPNGSVANGIPTVEFRGGTLESLGGPGWFNRDQNETTFQISNSLSVLAGRHSLKFGGTLFRQHFNTRGAFNQRGTVRFDGTRNTLIPRLSGNERASLLADFLLGLPSEAAITVGQFGRGFRQWNGSVFAQDSWQSTSRLVVNLGVRHDYTAPWNEVNSKVSNVLAGQGLVAAGPGFTGLYGADKNNFSPRVGLAYDMRGNGRTVSRAGFGILYETLLQANSVELIENNAPFSSSAITRAPTPFAGTGRSTTLLDLAALAAPSRSLGAIGSFQNPYTMQFNLGIQHRLTEAWLLEAGYAATRGLRLPVYRNGNQVPIERLTATQKEPIAAAVRAGLDTTSLLQPLRPFPQFDSITLSENIGVSIYHGGQLRLSRRFQSGLLFDTSYTFAKSIDNASDFNSADPSEQVLNAYDLGRQRAVSSFDIRHRMTASAQYRLPTLRGVSGALRALLAGWAANGLLTVQSAQPFTPYLPGFDPFRNEAFNRPNAVGDPHRNVPEGFAFNPAAFRTAAQGEFGNAGRNVVRGDSYRSLDLSVFRAFRFGNERSLQLRFEFINALNTVNFQGPSVDLSAAPAAFVAAAPPRVAQAGLKFTF